MSEETKEFKVIESQDQLDAIIKTRLERNEKKITESLTAQFTEKYNGWVSPDDVKSYTDKIEELTKASETSAQTIADLTSKISTLETSRAKMDIAREIGLPIDIADRISGTTEEEMRADATKLLAFVKPTHSRQEFQAEMPDTMSGVERAFRAKNPNLKF